MTETPATRSVAQIAPLALTWVQRGDVINVRNEIADRTESLMVFSPCATAAKGYHCCTCNRHCVNIGNLMMHLESGGAHHVAVWCDRHRVYEAPEPTQLAAFAAIAAGEG